MTRVAAIVQARMESTRLPGKVLMPLAGFSALACVLDRLGSCTELDEVCVATSTSQADDAVAAEADRYGAQVYRGSVDDVLDRFLLAARSLCADVIVRITADCPLIDAQLVDEMMRCYFAGPASDYMSNALPRTFPRGLDTEIISRTTLERAAAEAREKYEREHVTPYIYEHPKLFWLRGYVDPAGTDNSSMRWTLDTAEDYAFLQAVYEAGEKARPRDLSTAEVMQILARAPSLSNLNASVRQKHLGE